MALTCISLVLDAGVIPSGNPAFPYFVAAQNGLTSALCTCLLINGFVGFQLYEDGTTLSVWLLRFFSATMFIVSGAVSLLTFKGWAGLGPQNTIGMFVVLYIFSCLFLATYACMQVFLVVATLQDRWPLGDILFGVVFLIVGQLLMYVFSTQICDGASHYLDGLFFATICNLLGVMMVYKVSLPFVIALWLMANIYISTGIQSPRKTSSSASEPSKTTGKSRNCCRQKMSAEQLSITMPTLSTPAVSTTSLRLTSGTLATPGERSLNDEPLTAENNFDCTSGCIGRKMALSMDSSPQSGLTTTSGIVKCECRFYT